MEPTTIAELAECDSAQGRLFGLCSLIGAFLLRISMVEAVEDRGEAVETETSPLRFFYSFPFSKYYVTHMFVPPSS